MKIYAYRLDQRGPRSLAALIDRLNGLDLADRFIGDMGVRLEERGRQNGYLIMDFARARTGHGPGHMDRRTPMREFTLQPGASFAEDTAIAYDPASRYAAAQYNHSGPRALTLERYLRAVDMHFGGIREKRQNEHDEDVAGFTFGSVLKRSAYQRIRRMGIIREVDFAIAVPGVLPGDIQMGRSLGSVLDAPLPEGVETVQMVLKASPDRNSSIAPGGAREIVSELRRAGSRLRRAKIKGKTGYGERAESIDLLHEQVVREVDIRVGRSGRYSRPEKWGQLAETLSTWIEGGELAN